MYKMDAMLVLPATGDFMAKMANSITDNAANLAVKATLRNQSPIIVAVSTNDGLRIKWSKHYETNEFKICIFCSIWSR